VTELLELARHGTSPEISVLHFNVQFALVMVKTSKFGVEIFHEQFDTL